MMPYTFTQPKVYRTIAEGYLDKKTLKELKRDALRLEEINIKEEGFPAAREAITQICMRKKKCEPWFEKLNFLLESGLDPNSTHRYDETLLDYAIAEASSFGYPMKYVARVVEMITSYGGQRTKVSLARQTGLKVINDSLLKWIVKGETTFSNKIQKKRISLLLAGNKKNKKKKCPLALLPADIIQIIVSYVLGKNEAKNGNLTTDLFVQ